MLSLFRTIFFIQDVPYLQEVIPEVTVKKNVISTWVILSTVSELGYF
jgi:hypothetical protein